MPEKFYLTTPIYYVNARPHIGHAYTTIAADVIARRHRLLGHDTFFLTGTDEHGQKIERSAAAAGIPPQQFADEVSASFEALWHRMGITNDAFIRTTSAAHKRGAQKLFADLHARGQIYLSSYTGQYSIGEEMFVDGPPGTIGPDGKPTETVTEENFFFRLSDYQLPLLDLIESNTLQIQPEARKNEVLSFLRGDVAETAKAAALQSTSPTPSVILSEAKDPEAASPTETPSLLPTEGLGAPPSAASSPKVGGIAHTALGTPYVPGALRDLSVSRSSFTWGIPVPEPAASETKQKHVIYVWLDALANYMTALGYGSDDESTFNKFWPADLHLVGKEIIRFHCVYWPAFLLALNPKLQHKPGEPTPQLPFEGHRDWAKKWLPTTVTAHGWLLFDDAKMSKSKGNIVRTETILDAFGEHVYKKQFPDSTKQEQDLFAADVLRYFLLREIPFGQDGSFSFDALITRYNADLANGYGNLVSRTLAMIEQNFRSTIPEPSLSLRASSVEDFIRYEQSQSPSYVRPELVNDFGPYWVIRDAIAEMHSTLQKSGFSTALEDHWSRLALVDRQLTYYAPWKYVADVNKRQHVIDVLYLAAEYIRVLVALLYPFLPNATAKVWQQLGLGDIELAAKNGELTNLQWGGLKPGTRLGPLSPIFPRADKGLAQIMIDMEAANAAPKKPEPDTADPAAGPRTAAFTEPNPGATVAGSNALTTERVHTPHTEATPSGIFAAETATPQIAIDDFLKVDLRVARILVAERIPKADKLLRLEVDLGYEKRQILSGIAQWYTPKELIGRRIVIVANLAPRKMRGLESHGMLLAASEGENGKPILTTFGEDIALGSRVR